MGKIQVSQTSVIPPQRIQLPASLCWSGRSLPLSALVDSGAEENFIDTNLAKQMGIPTEALSFPLEARGLNGHHLAQVQRRTVPVPLILAGNHHETISLHLMNNSVSPLVLGFPWLKRHNPHIDWALGRILAWSPHCHAVCLRSAVTPNVAVAPSPPETIDLHKVPKTYHDLAPVFSKDRALSLPPHRPYDCAIDLLPGATLPSSRLYNLTRSEHSAMESYIKDSLAAGIMRPSSSPVGAGFFFVDKKDKSLRPCIDFRGLNSITVKNKYPLPLISSAFTPLHGSTIFTKLDLRNAYHLVRIRQGDEWKTAFTHLWAILNTW